MYGRLGVRSLTSSTPGNKHDDLTCCHRAVRGQYSPHHTCSHGGMVVELAGYWTSINNNNKNNNNNNNNVSIMIIIMMMMILIIIIIIFFKQTKIIIIIIIKSKNNDQSAIWR